MKLRINPGLGKKKFHLQCWPATCTLFSQAIWLDFKKGILYRQKISLEVEKKNKKKNWVWIENWILTCNIHTCMQFELSGTPVFHTWLQGCRDIYSVLCLSRRRFTFKNRFLWTVSLGKTKVEVSAAFAKEYSICHVWVVEVIVLCLVRDRKSVV